MTLQKTDKSGTEGREIRKDIEIIQARKQKCCS